MSSNRRSFLKALGTAVGTIGVAGCAAAPGGDPEPPVTDPADENPTDTRTQTRTTTKTPDGGAKHTIQMVSGSGDYYFDPIGLFVESGTTVTWEVKRGVHSSTAYEKGNSLAQTTRIPEDAEAWNSTTLSGAGASFEHTFEVSGTYDYFCIPHKTLGMVGRIVVDEPGGPAVGSMPPDGTVPKSDAIVEQGAVPYSEFAG